MSKQYLVEFKYVSYVSYTVDADSEEQAEQVAQQRLDNDYFGAMRSGEWTTESLEQMEGESK